MRIGAFVRGQSTHLLPFFMFLYAHIGKQFITLSRSIFSSGVGLPYSMGVLWSMWISPMRSQHIPSTNWASMWLKECCLEQPRSSVVGTPTILSRPSAPAARHQARCQREPWGLHVQHSRRLTLWTQICAPQHSLQMLRNLLWCYERRSETPYIPYTELFA